MARDWKPEDGKLGARGMFEKPGGWIGGVILAVVFGGLIAFATCSDFRSAGTPDDDAAADTTTVEDTATVAEDSIA